MGLVAKFIFLFTLWTLCNANPTTIPSPSPSPDDCEIEEGGRMITFYCPYESILMEHCYRCYQSPDIEVIHCDGWSEQEIRDQCESSVPLPSPSPIVEAY
uniref:Chitin-binding type-2 domain-containing protein n=1 Tax=Eutreptiella gymnastica TaxID=73025 RepID=A0A7S4LA13_9EUGL|mmetsp:Transcript_78042/g.131091  ORF Transcript_78042/g.131091 Transcript_78042/m.131091 type:complete len:100 (+) Transcript_78042:37-336(+)